jgi:S1-C subfamily serine protease
MRRLPCISLLLLALTATLLQSLATPRAALAAPESAVVRITAKDGERNKTGTGFIVQIAADIVYIVTASHVVEGDDAPKIEFFTQRDRPVAGTVKAAEVGDPKGLALLAVSSKQAVAPG